MQSRFGTCSICGSNLVLVWFIEEETKIINGVMYKTGKKRKACSHLECTTCFKNVCIDDSFDGNWY
ncbi:hypothetical protein [Clostridium tagluense]|uniref:Uncharacterized protein n=1 Tax=Clostridium tagluense TaxID=360422 RepID=A0A401UQ89_9CLOT|nr:hypothetical protein [Clostridium tagluense]GCD11681.1 hypothetical protein Ctaglu_33040 [Clostridium tagluense]